MNPIEHIELSPPPSLETLLARRVFIYGGIGNGTQIVKPDIKDFKITREYHELLGHYSFKKIFG